MQIFNFYLHSDVFFTCFDAILYAAKYDYTYSKKTLSQLSSCMFTLPGYTVLKKGLGKCNLYGSHPAARQIKKPLLLHDPY